MPTDRDLELTQAELSALHHVEIQELRTLQAQNRHGGLRPSQSDRAINLRRIAHARMKACATPDGRNAA